MKQIIIFLFVFINTHVWSQNPNYHVIGKDIFDGIHLYSIVEGEDNSIFITSDNGLYRYNGISFNKIPNPIDRKTTSLFGLTKNQDGDIFCFDFLGNIYQIKNNKLQLYYTIPKKYLGGDFSMLFDTNNTLVINTNHNQYRIVNDSIQFCKKRGMFATNHNKKTYYGADIGEKNAYIFSNDKDNCEEIYTSLGDNHYIASHSILMSHKGGLYGYQKNRSELYKFDNDSYQIQNLPFKKNRYDVYSTTDYLWFCDAKNGVYKYNPNKPQEPQIKWFKDYYISGIYKDSEDNTWFLTFNNGIIVVPNLDIVNLSIEGEKIVGVEKIDNQIYVSTLSGKIYSYKHNEFEYFFGSDTDQFNGFEIYPDINIVVSNHSIYSKDKRINNKIGYNRGSIMANGKLYLALHSGLHSFDFTTNKQTMLTSNRTTSICNDASNDKIIFSSLFGLHSYKNGKVTDIEYKGHPIYTNQLTNVGNEIWASTTKGIHLIKNGEVYKRLSTDDGLLNTNINQIQYDAPYVYLVSNKAIQRINSETFEVEHFLTNQCISNINSFQVLNGTLYTLTSKGLIKFKTEQLSSKIKKYQTILIESLINGSVPLENNQVLKSDLKNVEFSFTTPTYKYKKNLSFEYQLIGYDKTPIKAKLNQNTIYYSNLPPGSYDFVVNSKIGSKHINIPAKISFKILPIWYKTTWFKALITLLLTFSLYAIYSLRVSILLRKKNLLEMNKRLSESTLVSLKAQMNPHFMFNALNSVQSLIIKNKKDEAYDYLTKFSELIRQTLNASDKTWISINEEHAHLVNYIELERLRFSDDFSYTISIQDDIRAEKIPSMLIQPFVENAIKHGLRHKIGEKRLLVSFSRDNNMLECIIEDNGIGRKASYEINKSNNKGYNSTNAIEQRFELLKEYLNLDIYFKYIDNDSNDSNSSGTKVVIKIPFNIEYE